LDDVEVVFSINCDSFICLPGVNVQGSWYGCSTWNKCTWDKTVYVHITRPMWSRCPHLWV